ncbi:MAG: hypothetical protein LBG17_08375 [Bacteroidales bacterium]|jgi:hypothetical protein|nr:hypothetical protein [Bacteroidales bacterium]
MKKFLLLCLLAVAAGVNAQVRYPVTVSGFYLQKTSPFISDYLGEPSKHLNVSLTFNDLQEPYIEVYLQLFIESSNVKLQTSPSFRSAVPIKLYPAETAQLSDEQLTPYFNPLNMICSGITQERLLKGEILPEGLYTFSIKIFEQNSGKEIARETKTSAFIKQFEPPVLVTPVTSSLVQPNMSDIFFSFRQPMLAELQQFNPEYILSLYEIPNEETRPEQAINGSGQPVFISEPFTDFSFRYGITEIPLQQGKRYAWSVKVITEDGREIVKNKGLSNVGWFYYGYPSDGKIILDYPANEAALRKTDAPLFRWKSCSNIIDNTQPVTYKMYVAHINDKNVSEEIFDEAQSDLQVITLGPYFNKTSVEHTLKNALQYNCTFAWMVKAFTAEQEIGKSEIRIFSSPKLIESFICGGGGGHLVKITSLENNDLSNLSGKGLIKVNENGETAEVSFNNISLANSGFYYLKEGEIRNDISSMMSIKLSPHISENGNMTFYPDSMLITPASLRIKGSFKWKFPLKISDTSIIEFYSQWLNFDELKLLGTSSVNRERKFILESPKDFIITIDSNSYISFENDVWRMNFSGVVTGHSSVRTQNNSIYSIPFENWKQLMINVVLQKGNNGSGADGADAGNNIRPLKNVNLFIVPKEIIINFSDMSTPNSNGIYFREFNVAMQKELDIFGQIVLSENTVENIFINDNSALKAHIDENGLRFFYTAETSVLSDTFVKFNTFPSPVDTFKIDIKQSTVSKAFLKGHIKIPLISTEHDFSFLIPLSDDGFQTGFLEEELAGMTFVLNADDEAQKIKGQIKRAFFDNNDHLSLDISLEWEHIGLYCTHIPRFFIYGNTDIGFGGSGGVASLTEQQQGSIDGYDVNFQGVGAGRMCSEYAFAVTGAIVLDENISGKNGPAITNAYSIEENPLLSKDCQMTEQQIETRKLAPTEGTFTMSDDGFGSPENDLDNSMYAAQRELVEHQTAIYSNALTGIADAINSLISDDEDNADNGFSFDWNGFNSGKGDTSSWDDNTQLSLKDIVGILKAVSEVLDSATAKKINEYVGVLTTIEPSAEEVNKWIKIFKDGSFAKVIAEGIAAKVIPYVEKPLAEQADKLKQLMHDKTMFAVDTVLDMLIGLIDKASDAVFKSAMAAQELSDNPAKLKDKLQIILKEAIDEVMFEIKRSVDSSIETNIIPYFTNFIDTIVHRRIADFLEGQIAKTVHKLITKQTKSITLKEFVTDAKEHFVQTGNDFVKLFKWSNLKAMLAKTGKDIINGYDWLGIAGKISTELTGVAVRELLGDKLTEINKQLENTGLGNITDALANNVKIDFTKLKSGDMKNAIKFDPTFIKIQSPVADAEGYAKRVKNDPVYGDVFRAGLNVTVKMPKKFNVWATFLNGKTAMSGSDAETASAFNYWFMEISCRKLGIPMSPVPLSFDGAAGRVFRRMSRKSGTMASEYIPDYNTKFGAEMSAWFFDTPGKGAIAVFGVDFSLDILEQDKFRMTMLGDANISNTINEKGDVKKSLIHGQVEAGYSNADNIFYANARVTLNTSPLICAGGEFRARITPDEWSVSVGTRQNPLSAKLLCMDFAKVEAWTEVDNRHFDIGVHSLVNVSLKSPWIGSPGFRARATSTLYFEMLTDAVVYWKPLKLRDANFWLESELEVGADYDIMGSEGHFTLLGLIFGGGMTYLSRTQEEMIAWQGKDDCPSKYTSGNYSCIRGWLHGSMTILGINFNVSVEGKKEWKG